MATLGLNEAQREAVERFEREVVQPSMDAVVILDFWAEWCGPCKQLTPLLEKIVADYADKGVKLVKIDVDEQKLIAAQFRVQSIPTVYAFYQGQPVADLTSYRTESQLKTAFDQLLGELKIGAAGAAPQADIAPLMAMGEQILSEGDAPRAVSVFGQIREMAPDDPEVAGALVRPWSRPATETKRSVSWRHCPPRLRASRRSPGLAPHSTSRRRPRPTPRQSNGESRPTPMITTRGSSLPGPKLRRATAMPPPTPCSQSSPATPAGTKVRRASGFSSCLRRKGWPTRGRGSSGGGCRR